MTYSVDQYITPIVMTVAGLHSSFPPSATTFGKYARVNDLYGSVDDIMRCRYDGTAYKWIPQREVFNGTIASTGGTVTIQPLITPPTIRVTGNLGMTVTPSSTWAYIGQRQYIVQESTLGIVVTTVTGLLGSNLTLLGNAVKAIEYSATGWFSLS